MKIRCVETNWPSRPRTVDTIGVGTVFGGIINEWSIYLRTINSVVDLRNPEYVWDVRMPPFIFDYQELDATIVIDNQGNRNG